MGYIYIFVNPSLKDMVKIGYATDVKRRVRELSTTALPTDYEIYATYETTGKLEDKKLHKLIDNLNPDLRISKNREFFMMTAEDAYELLESIAIISGTQDRLKRVLTEDDIVKERSTARRPNIDFFKCGIPKGAKLVCTLDENIVVEVATEHKVLYKNELTSLTAIVKELVTYDSVSGPRHFMYKGRCLSDIYNETQGKL